MDKRHNNKHSMIVDANTGETLITKAKYSSEQGFGGKGQNISNITNINTKRTI